MNIRRSMFLIYFIALIFLSFNYSFACENVIECFEEGNINISEWDSSIQLQLAMVIILTVLFYKLLMEYFSENLNMKGSYSFTLTGIIIVAVLFTMSVYQNLEGILRLLVLVAILPIGVLSFNIGKKIKGESEIGSIRFFFAILIGFYIFVRVTTIMFGAGQLEEAISLLGFSLGSILTSLVSADVIVVGAALFLMNNNSNNNSLNKTGKYSNKSLFDNFSKKSKDNELNNNQNSNQERFPSNTSQKYTEVVYVLQFQESIKRQVYPILQHVQSLKPEDDKTLLKQYLQSLNTEFIKFSNTINSQPFSAVGTFHSENDTPDSVISTLNAMYQKFDSIKTEEIDEELRRTYNFLETMKLTFQDANNGIAVLIDLGSYMYYKNDFNQYLQKFFKSVCNDLAIKHPILNQNQRITELNNQIQKTTLKSSNKELIKSFINLL